MKSFVSLDKYSIFTRGLEVYAVELDETVENFDDYINHKVLIDNKEVLCYGVERYTHTPPWHKGEKVGIAVKKDSEVGPEIAIHK